jgi:hypothetical protein
MRPGQAHRGVSGTASLSASDATVIGRHRRDPPSFEVNSRTLRPCERLRSNGERQSKRDATRRTKAPNTSRRPQARTDGAYDEIRMLVVGRALAGTPAFADGPPSETPNRDDSTPKAIRERPSAPASSKAKLLREQKAQSRGLAGTRPHQDRGERRGLVGNGGAPLAVPSLNLRQLRRR